MAWRGLNPQDRRNIQRLLTEGNIEENVEPFTSNRIPDQRLLFLELKNGQKKSNFQKHGVKLDVETFRPSKHEGRQKFSHENIMLKLNFSNMAGITAREKLINYDNG